MSHALPRSMKAALAAFAVLLVTPHASGQARPSGSSDTAKLEIYGGYGYWNPEGAGIHGSDYPAIYNPNATGSLTAYFTRHFGVQIEGSYFSIGRTFYPDGTCNADPCSPVGIRLYTGEAGPVFRLPMGRLVPYAHALAGGVKLSGPSFNSLTWGWGVTGGVGADYILPYFHNLLAIRVIEADYQYQQVDYGPLYLPAATLGGAASFPALKLSAGLVLRLGSMSSLEAPGHNALMVDCDVAPSSLYPGDPAHVTFRPMNQNPHRPMAMSWTTTGGRLIQTEDGATLATAGMAPGDYTVTGTLTQGRHTAQCSSNFTIKRYEPPTLTCLADPATVPEGGVTTITATGSSIADRPLTYSFTADAGQITGTGPRVQLSTTGVTAQTVNVTCNVVDDLGKTAQSATSVAVMSAKSAALPPPLADTQQLCGVSFERDQRRPVRVNNEAKACLDDIAITLQRQPDATLVVVGNFSQGETATEGAERSLNVRQYLTDEKGVDIGRIQPRYGIASGRNVDDILVPAGASFSNDKTTAFDPTSVKRVGQPYGKHGQPTVSVRRHPHHAAVTRRRRHRRHYASAPQVPAPQ
jgi:hypothetical protein